MSTIKTNAKEKLDLKKVISYYYDNRKLPETSFKLAELAREIKDLGNNNKLAKEALEMGIGKIKCFDDGLFVQPIVKYTFPEVLPSFAPVMLGYAETVEELLYANDLFLAHGDTKECRKILSKAEEQAKSIDEYLQLASSMELVDPNHAEEIFNNATNAAETFEDYMLILHEGSYFYGWPGFLTKERVKDISGKAVFLAEEAEDFKELSDFFIYYRELLDPSIREEKLEEIIIVKRSH